MFKKIFLITSLLILSFLAFEVQARHNLAGRILLQVEQNGEAYYFHPESLELHFLGRPDDAFTVMREQGIGISNDNLLKIPVADTNALKNTFEGVDSDGDGYDDYTELINHYNPYGEGRINYDLNFASKNAGKIFLQVENNGEAWYVNGEDNKRYFLGRPSDAFEIMRTLGLGISNDNLDILLAINEEEEVIVIEEEEEEEEGLVLEDDDLLFAYNLFSDCQPMSLELMDEGVLYHLNNLGLNESQNYCNIEVSVLNIEDLSALSMTCQTPTIYHYLSEIEGSGEISAQSVSDNDYLNYVSWLPMMYNLDIEEHQGEGNCSGPLVSALLENNLEVEENVEDAVVSSDLNWQLLDDGYNLNFFATENSLYQLKQTDFSTENTKVAVYSYNTNDLIKEYDEMITKIFVDSQNRIWGYNNVVGTGLHLLVNNNWYKFTAENSQLASNNIRKIAENGSGIWIATDKGLNYLKNGNWSFYSYLDWYPEDTLMDNNVLDLAANSDYVVFSTGFELYIYRDDSFIRLEGVSGKNIHLFETIAWFYLPLSYSASQLNLDDYSGINLEIDPALENFSPDDFVIKDIVSHQASYWFLVSAKSSANNNLIIVNLKDNTSYYYYSQSENSFYANQLISFNDELYLNFSNGFGLYKVSVYDN